ncbi:sensor histidine kinase [Nocardiopsis halotolerans]|uniref:sensor histidine kinase n=1 Tax=Nocardiopsis halotolerans TaxID=124252 RepID=UPI00034CBCAA|nr:HAMP domain-containing sensor histidine kinase [Nocardiopsis halotolerans]
MSGWDDGLRRAWERIRPRSIRAQVTFTALAGLAFLIGVGLFLTLFFIRETVMAQVRDRAAEEALQVADHIAAEPYTGPIPEGEAVLRIQVVARDSGEVLASSNTLEGRPQLTSERPLPGESRLDTTVCGPGTGVDSQTCLLVVGYSVDDTVYGDVVVLAATGMPQIVATRTLEATMLVTSAALLVATGLVIWIGVGRALRPVEAIRAQLDTLSVSALDRRLPVPDSQDEIAHLARTANDSLERMEEAVNRQRRFVSDASHELRNPIAGMRTRLEVELSDPDPDPRMREMLLTGLLSDTERLENIVSDLLELARLDSGATPVQETIELAGLVSEEFATGRRAPELRLHSSGPVYVYANRLRVVRVLTNLIANATRHAESRIDVIVRREEGFAVVEVHDDGAGIPPGERERVFERFSRLRESRERDPGGSGLGLPISREIAQAHGGSLLAGHSELLGGAAFVLRIPEHAGPPEQSPERPSEHPRGPDHPA